MPTGTAYFTLPNCHINKLDCYENGGEVELKDNGDGTSTITFLSCNYTGPDYVLSEEDREYLERNKVSYDWESGGIEIGDESHFISVRYLNNGERQEKFHTKSDLSIELKTLKEMLDKLGPEGLANFVATESAVRLANPLTVSIKNQELHKELKPEPQGQITDLEALKALIIKHNPMIYVNVEPLVTSLRVDSNEILGCIDTMKSDCPVKALIEFDGEEDGRAMIVIDSLPGLPESRIHSWES